jgi:stage III sporulation protein AB
MLKIIALSAIGLACIAVGMYFRAGLARRAVILRQMTYVLDTVITLIKFERAPLRDIFEKLKTDSRLFELTFIPEVGSGMDAGCSFADSYTAAVARFTPPGLTARDRDIIGGIGSVLGITGAEGQIASLSVYAAELGEAADSARDNLIRKSKLYSSLGLLAGAFIIILLL